MNEESYLLNPKDKKQKTPYEWFMTFLKICFFLLAFMLVIITVLANMGGNGEIWHEGVRGFISEFSGRRPVKLGKLNHMGFFPSVSLDVEDVDILSSPDDIVPLVKVKKLRIGMPFLDVATRSPRVSEFYVDGLSAIKGVFMPKEFYIDKIFIDHDQVGKQATLRANGKIGLQPWNFEAGLEVQKSFTGKYNYVLAPITPFAFNFADVQAKGTYNHISSKHLKIEEFELRSGDKSIGANLTISSVGDDMFKVKGALDIQNMNTVISPDIIIEKAQAGNLRTKLSGDITSEKIVLEDLVGEESVFAIFTRIRELMGYSREASGTNGFWGFLDNRDLSVHVYLENVLAGDASYEALDFDVMKEDGLLRIGKITGKDDRELMPAFMLLKETASNVTNIIVQDGNLDIAFVRPWFANLPHEFSGKQSAQIRCGIGSLATNEYKKFAMDTKDGIIRVRETSANDNHSPFDTSFYLSDDGGLDKIKLSKDQYDFVQASLQRSGSGSSCVPYISLKEPKSKEEPKQE